jgi:dTDP-L-rhamnose 4-epimerase
MSIYGEGRARCPACGPVSPPLRPLRQLQARDWEIRCPRCGAPAEPAPTDEDKPLGPTSVYAVTKRDQEELCLCVGRAWGIPTVALRLFNTYGPRQALSNPYTGVAAIFASRLLNGQAPLAFEDGLQRRDFVHVTDVARAFQLALDRSDVADVAVNVGTGRATTVRDVAAHLARALGVAREPEIVGRFREGDVRHCVAGLERARQLLGFEPRVAFADGIRELAAWASTEPAEDRAAEARAELEARGLVR